MNNYEPNFKIGDKIYCLIHGEGIIESIFTYAPFSVKVRFKNNSEAWYTINGKYDIDSNITLFHKDAITLDNENRVITIDWNYKKYSSINEEIYYKTLLHKVLGLSSTKHKPSFYWTCIAHNMECNRKQDEELQQSVQPKIKEPYKTGMPCIVRDTSKDTWQQDIFLRYCNDYIYKTTQVIARYCLPLEGNEHLVGTTNNN